MFGKAFIVFTLCNGVAALNLQQQSMTADAPRMFRDVQVEQLEDGPVEFSKVKEMLDSPVEFVSNPVEFTAQYRMSLVRQMQSYTFDDFMSDHEKDYKKGSAEYKKRAAIFYRRKAETIRLTGLSKLTWTPAINKFMDQTKPEIQGRLGYRPEKGRKAKGSSFARKPMEEINPNWVSSIQMSWLDNMTLSKSIDKDQGACGSCWAVATTSAVEAHADIYYGATVPLSEQQLVSCTPNPRHCGGKGGCEGATAELALDYLEKVGGMVMEQDYEYISMFGDSGQCDEMKVKHPTVMIGGYKGVPTNNLAATMYALSQGPLIVAVDAGKWSFYGGGIFNSCKRDAVLNHAVVLVGYGLQGLKGYWMIRNSWGSDWGMNGYIMLSRQTTATKANFCGMDRKPQEGSACDGENDPVKVCGMCGILYEPVLPIVTSIKKPTNYESIVKGIQEKKLVMKRKMMKRKFPHLQR